jgi:hypothetical protein
MPMASRFCVTGLYWWESLLVGEFEASAGDIFAFGVLAIGAELNDSVA